MSRGRVLTTWGVLSGGAVAAALAAAAGVAAVAARRVLVAERAQRSGTRPVASGDMLLVLGAHAFPDRPSRELQARLDHGARRWREGAAPTIGVSGGIDGTVDEAQVMAAYLRDAQHVPPDAVVRVVPGDNTRSTLRAMARAAAERSLGNTVIAVSSPYHARRLVAEGRRCGLRVVADCPSSTPESDNPEIRRTRLFGEVVGSILYAAPERAIEVARYASVPVRRHLPRIAATVGDRVRRRSWQPQQDPALPTVVG